MEEKTNVMRLLEQKKIKFQSHHLDITEAISGVEMAAMLRQNPEQVFKTLVTVGKTKTNYVFVIPVGQTLNLKRAASACGEKSVEMIPQKLLLPTTGYIHGGCSPIGMKKAFPTFIDETAQLFDTICVSAGKIGIQAELPPDELCRLTGAQYVPLTD